MSHFQYSCFISYSHGEGDLVRGFVTQFKAALKDELETLIAGRKPFIDDDIPYGAKWDPYLAKALCHSVCMVVIYTPVYGQKVFCRREFKAMEELEERRLAMLQGASPTLGLIIPVVMRGFAQLPQPIGPRQAVDFSHFTLADVQMNRHPGFAPKVKEVAERIADHFWRLQALEDEACKFCDAYQMPAPPPETDWRHPDRAGWAPAFVNR
ncbi:MAG: toll/interleukin-1 receptor domain-containing protein [Caldimonas sp.]